VKVYTDSEFRAGKIPKKEDFSEALEEFEKKCVFDRHRKVREEIYGGFVYGSMARDEVNPASDIDYFLVVNEPQHLWEIKKSTKAVYAHYNILVQKRALTLEEAQKGQHALQINFFNHLLMAKDKYGYHGQDPIGVLKLNNKKVRKAVRETLCHYLDRLTTGYVSDVDEKSHAQLLEAILNKPIYCIQEMIQFSLKGPVQKDGQMVDDFEGVRDLFFEQYGKRNLLLKIMQIHDLRKKYKGVLEERLERDMDEEIKRKWETVMEDIFFKHSTAVEIIKECLDLTQA